MATRKRGLLESYIPEPAGLGQPQSAPPLGLLGTAENVSMGLGRGVTNQLAGLLGMVQNPGAVVNSLYSLARTPPNQLAQMAVTGVKEGTRNALAGPLGFGEFIGNNMSPRSLLPGVKTTREMTAYHGSPHDFDEFKLNKDTISTGEGAQAYGHGLYFAESPEVANSYRLQTAYKAFDVGPEAEKLGIPLNAGGRGEFIRQARENVDSMTKAKRLQYANAAARSIPQEKLASLFDAYAEKGGGRLYHVDIPDEAIDKMLDWDKPLSQQPEAVRAAFANAADDLRYGPLKKNAPILDPNDKYTTAGDAYKALALHLNGGSRVSRMGGSVDGADKAASEYLKSIGIPGIRYLDGGSRAGGKGTRNFVVFDDKLVKVLKKE